MLSLKKGLRHHSLLLPHFLFTSTSSSLSSLFSTLLLFSPFLFVWNKVIKQRNADSSTQRWHQVASLLTSRGDAFYSTPARRSQMLPRTLQPSQPVMALPCGAELGCKAACWQYEWTVPTPQGISTTTHWSSQSTAGPGKYFPNRSHWYPSYHSKQSCFKHNVSTGLLDGALWTRGREWPHTSHHLKGHNKTSTSHYGFLKRITNRFNA